MGITERQKEILNWIVQEYIASAWPVSSHLLEKKAKLGLSPATIRNEMLKLTEEGYLYQPHTSAGRIPTDKGYRFFVDNLLDKGISEVEDIFWLEEILKEGERDIFRFASHLSKFLAETSSNLATVHLLEKDFFFKEGWEEVLEEPEFEKKDLIFGFAKLLKDFEKNIKELKLNSKIKVYIGKESPFPKAKDFSIISSKCVLPDREEGIISILGPKRMEYEKNISLINSLAKVLAEARKE